LEGVPKEIVEFLAEHIESAVQLEVLLFMRARGSDELDAEQIARELRVSAPWTAAALAKLAASGLLIQTAERFQFAPRSPQIEQTISLLAKEYELRRVTIISIIFSKPSDAIQHFTDAFKFRRDEKK
jgi:hypothetical protein